MKSRFLAVLAAGALAVCAGCGPQAAPTSTGANVTTPTTPRKTGTVQIKYDDRPSILIEPELGEITAPMKVYTDPTASGGKYILAPEGENHKELSVGGYATVRFKVAVDGDYALWFRAKWCCGCGNSLGIVVDGQDLGYIEDGTFGAWHWVALRTGTPPKMATIPLKAGEHTLVISNREDGSSLDQVLLTADPDYRPSEMETSDARGRIEGTLAGPASATVTTAPALTTTTMKP